MKWLRRDTLLPLAFCGLAATSAALYARSADAVSPAAQTREGFFNPTIISDVAERVSPAVVSITTRGSERPSNRMGSFGPFDPDHGAGMGVASGVVISADGYIVTNNHVVENAGQVRVRMSDGRELKASIVGTDASSDLAVLKVDAKNLPFLQFGDSAKLRLGEFVLAVGNPFGVGQTVTMGIVSAKGRSNVGIVDYEDFVQTDAAINPGNSGGALVNLDGTLVGINTAILSRSGGAAGIGFAVPSTMAKPIIQQIREHGRVSRGWLGVGIQDLTPALASNFGIAETEGALISDVIKGGPADAAGFQPGDVVVSIDERAISSSSQLRNMIAMITPGTRTKVEVRRGKSTETLSVKLTEKKDREASEE